MGLCVSLRKTPDSDTKLRSIVDSKTNKQLIQSPPIPTEKSINGKSPINGFGFNSRSLPLPMPPVTRHQDYESKDENFFDSQLWFESDCEDYFSVNGDFTPSRGNTPNHQSSFIGTPRRNNSLHVEKETESKPEPSPTSKKKKLAELLEENLSSDQVPNNQNISSNQDIAIEELDRSMSRENSIREDDRTSNGYPKTVKEKSGKSNQCCLPRMVISRSINEKRRG